MPVFLLKIEGLGHKLRGWESDDPPVKLYRFVSRHALVAGEHPNDTPVNERDKELREQVVHELTNDHGCTEINKTGGATTEVSKEHLLELAEYARTRDEIASERENALSV